MFFIDEGNIYHCGFDLFLVTGLPFPYIAYYCRLVSSVEDQNGWDYANSILLKIKLLVGLIVILYALTIWYFIATRS
jgi:hypothetical protein